MIALAWRRFFAVRTRDVRGFVEGKSEGVESW